MRLTLVTDIPEKEKLYRPLRQNTERKKTTFEGN